MKKLVLNDGTYKYDNRTRQVSVSEEQLKKAGYAKLADNERKPKYYIKFPAWMASEEEDEIYLNVYGNVGWGLSTKTQYSTVKTQFTQSKIDELQKDEQAKGLDLNAFKVRVPDNELED